MDDAQAPVEHGGPDPVLYPDICRVGSLQQALQETFDRTGLGLIALPERAPGWRYVGARVEDLARNTNIVMGIRERVFTMEFWSSGVCMAQGNTADLAAVAAATHAWQSGARVRDLSTGSPFVHYSALAEAHERGEAAEFTWQSFHENPRQAPQLTALHAFVTLAIRESRLRELMPFTSMDTLGFSRTIGYPHSGGCPYVTPTGDGRYMVSAADGRTWGTADPAGAVALVLAALSPIETDTRADRDDG